MTRHEVTGFLRDHWWQIGALLLLVAGWVVRVEATMNRMDEMATDHEIVQGLGRMICRGDRASASLAGIPCGRLLFEWGER